MIDADTMVPVENHQRFPESWGGITIPAHSTRKIPYRIAKTLLGDPHYRVNLDGIAGVSPVTSEGGVHLTFQGPIDLKDGYGSCTPHMALALDRAGFYVRLGNTGHLRTQDIHPRVMELLSRDIDDDPALHLIMTWPRAINHGRGQIKYGYTMFETDRIPTKWATGACNRLRALFVPCQSNKDAFVRSGVTIPVYSVPLGIDGTEWPLYDRSNDREGRPFTFACFGTVTGRKNPQAAIRAFRNAFPTERDVRFIFKTRNGALGHNGMPALNVIANDGRFRIIDKEYTRDEILSLLHNEIDCFVFPSKGEGFGLPPCQAMATGLPVIVAANSGMLEYCDDQYNYSVKNCPMVAADEYPDDWGFVGNWWNPDVDELTHLMRHVYDNRDEAYRKGMASAKWIRARFSWDNTALGIINGIAADYPQIRDMLHTARANPIQNDVPIPITTRPHDMFINVLIAANKNGARTAMSISMADRMLKATGIGARFWLLDNGSPKNSLVQELFSELNAHDPERFVAIRSNAILSQGASMSMLLKAWKNVPRESEHECGLALGSEVVMQDVEGFGRMCDTLWKQDVMAVGPEGWHIQPNHPEHSCRIADDYSVFGVDVDTLSGYCQLFRMEIIEKCGMPRTDLLAAADMEYILRAKLQGYRVLHVGHAGMTCPDMSPSMRKKIEANIATVINDENTATQSA
jgi:glycosyltransferase involved in cell wall biosynthesis